MNPNRLRQTYSAKHSGITLIELMVTLFLISILAMLTASSVSSNRQRANERIARSDVMAFQLAVQTAAAIDDQLESGSAWRKPKINFFSQVSPASGQSDPAYYLHAGKAGDVLGVSCSNVGRNWTWVIKAQPSDSNSQGKPIYYYDVNIGFTDTNKNNQCDDGELW